MTWRIHHVNLPAINLRQTADFYTSVLDMADTGMPVKPGPRGTFGAGRQDVAWFEGDNAQIHVTYPSANMARDNGFYINPVINGHLSIEVSDIDEVKRRLAERDVYFADAGNWALTGYRQIYFHDPALNVIEVIAKTDR